MKKTDSGAEISKSTVVRGRVQGAESLSIAGRVEGTIILDAKLTIEKSAIVKADVEADEVIVRGVLVGEVRARRSVRIEAGARVKGDVEAPIVSIAEGAQFSGGLTTGEKKAEKLISPPATRYEVERVAPTEVLMRPVVDEERVERRRRITVKKRT